MTRPGEEAPRQGLPGLFLRGMAMGAADIVPGVSGGTIAFITGIYLRLLDAIGHAPVAFGRFLRHRRWPVFWRELDGSFLLTLFLGILTSVLTLARLLSHWLAAQPIWLWSFFFGLILAAAWHVGRQVPRWHWTVALSLVLGLAVAWGITLLTPAQLQPTPLLLLLGGALAICAMILPGISGSFILLLMGLYQPVLEAVSTLQWLDLLVFAAGCVGGLLLFARLIAWALHRFRSVMLGLLTGFMLGSLNKVWPWKVTTAWQLDRHGERVPLVQDNLGPLDYASVTGAEPWTGAALILMLGGALLVLGLERFGSAGSGKAVTPD